MYDRIKREKLAFLEGGGEMGKITREKDWSGSTMGPPETWPKSIKPILSLLLNSRFPMFLFWGPEYVCFYNDAYRPSLGKEGKHPMILGMKGKEAWPEIWDTIFPLLHQVRSGGESTWSENQLIPIYRNGSVEEVYWTFGYSPVKDEKGHIAGVFVTCTETTDSVASLKKLEESKNELQLAIDATDLGTWDYDPIKKLLKTNHRLKSWLGRSENDHLSFDDITGSISAEDKERVENALQEALTFHNGGKCDETFTLVNSRNRNKRVVRVVGRAWLDDAEKVYRFNGTMQDITEQQVIWDELKLKEERFRQLVQNAPIGIAIVDIDDFTVKIVNNMALNIWQKKEDDCQDRPLFEILPETKAGLKPILDKAIDSQKPQIGTEYPFMLDRNGVMAQGFFNFIFKPVVDKGQVSEIMLVAYEVTETVKAKFELEESEIQFKNIVEQSPIAMAILSGPELTIEMANDMMLTHFWHKKPEEVLQRSLTQVFPALRESQYVDQLNSVMQNGRPISRKDERIEVESGKGIRQMYVDYSYLPLRELDDTISKVMVVTNDNTNRVLTRFKLESFSRELEQQVLERTEMLKTANQKLQDSIQRLKNTNDELESFAYVASHDLKEPLRKVQMFMERIVSHEQETLSQKSLQYVSRIDNAVDRMRTLIDDLLSFSKTGRGEAELEKRDLREILEQVLDNLSEKIESTSTQVNYGKLGTAQIIPFQIRQVFQNLIENSIKFSKKGQAPVINIASKEVKGRDIEQKSINPEIDYYRLTFSDNGIGFASENSEKIFEIFQRLHGKLDYQGTGIGLAIVKKIMDNHNGWIRARSKTDEGATFELYLPKT
ncbi:PAS domain-containing protein [Pseudozobellia thermophila]|uniref:histidine kinase n=1 Tax=Pseudozobellia thermophila TaxID=192903 RepID=A0A1M6IRX2_9FLAO|nr:PAS domain-containing protein [Pseudozobellia thermophila]SHJ37204.1 PAS domain-containing protein [Pseudozobellia thermophila]